VSDAMLMELAEYGKKNKVEFDAKDFNKSKDYLKILVKAHLGRQIYDDNAFYKVINDINEVYVQAMSLFGEADRISMATTLKSPGVE
jgi:carboxyl-terminal processing protease